MYNHYLLKLSSLAPTAQEARESYSKAIDLLSPAALRGPPTAPVRLLLAVLHGNRAAAYFALSKFTEALFDCSIAAQYNPGYAKVQYRRAECWAALGDYGAAVNDLQRLQEKGAS